MNVRLTLINTAYLLQSSSIQGLLTYFTHHCRRAGAGLIGLSLSYALSITDILNGVLTTSAETEQEMVSVERILEYTQLPPQVSSYTLGTLLI